MGHCNVRTALAVAAACLAAATLSGQQVFKSSVEYVRLDVVVTDKQDRPIAGLTKDEDVDNLLAFLKQYGADGKKM